MSAADPAPPTAGTSARFAWTFSALMALAAALLLGGASAPILHGLSDEALLVPLARLEFDASLYASDDWLPLAEDVFSHVHSWLLGAVLRAFDDPVLAGRVLAYPFHVVFLAGSFLVLERSAGRRVAAQGVTVLVVLAAVLGAFDPGAAWPLAAGASLPRDLVFALLPWLWLGREGASAQRRAWTYLVVGLLANLHPLTALHLLAVFVVVDAATLPRSRFTEIAVGGVLALGGTAPFLFQWRAYPRIPGSASADVLAWRIEGIGTTTPSVWTGRIELALWFVAAAFVLGRGRRDSALRSLQIAAAASLVLAALHPAFHLVVEGIQFDRLARVAVWAAVLLLVAEAPRAWAARDRRAIVTSAVLAAVAVLGPALVGVTTGTARGPLEWAVRRAEVRLGLREDRPRSPAPDRPRPGDPSLDPALAAHFRAVCAWARASTPADALFAVPPEDWGAFRAYAARAAVVTRKEGGFTLSFLGGMGGAWFETYRGAVEVYAARDPGRWAEWSARPAYVVWDDAGATPLPVGWTELRRDGPYRVLRTSDAR